MNKKLGGPQSLPGLFGAEKNHLILQESQSVTQLLAQSVDRLQNFNSSFVMVFIKCILAHGRLTAISCYIALHMHRTCSN